MGIQAREVPEGMQAYVTGDTSEEMRTERVSGVPKGFRRD